MTRKRFIKLMMARGMNKNESMRIAKTVTRYGSYAALWRKYCYILLWNETGKLFAQAISAVTFAFANLSQTFSKALMKRSYDHCLMQAQEVILEDKDCGGSL